MAIHPDLFRRASSQFATGICIATVRRGEEPIGLTVNSFTSVSLVPPLVLFCLDREAGLTDVFAHNAQFAINILAESQQEASTSFAFKRSNRFEGISWRAGQNGAPVIEGSLATMECRLVRVLPAGDHYVLIGEVTHAELGDTAGNPLLYFRSKYARVAPPDAEGPD
jgi:flavin reductase (DIM6/NTAB) family NADH-FMN oxidoreductase RutF